MHHPSTFRLFLACSAVLGLSPLHAQIASFTTPNVVNESGPVSVTLGETRFINQGLVGMAAFLVRCWMRW
jgi:hypothetical protein